jgi:septum formation protein
MGLKNQYIIIPSPLDEKAIQNELTEQGQNLPPAAQYARILAERKAKAVASNILLLLQTDGASSIMTEQLSNAAEGNGDKISIQKYIIGCDTVVAIDEEILVKPRDDNDARYMLSRLSGRWHNVHTGIAIYSSTNNYESPITSFTETAKVKFTVLTPHDIDAYITTREHVDKAGSYGIQGTGGQIVESMKGDYYTVMGLPMHRLSRELANIINSSTV